MMNAFEVSLALIPMPGQEELVRRSFWHKVRRTLGRVPFLDRAVAAYYAATDPATPMHAKAMLFAALAYFILPLDLVPDIFAGIGFTDDGTVLMLALQAMAPHVSDAHVARAHRFLGAEADLQAGRRFYRQG
jgi:uncharacterized membrane protein YkvA (DUF1232 family)